MAENATPVSTIEPTSSTITASFGVAPSTKAKNGASTAAHGKSANQNGERAATQAKNGTRHTETYAANVVGARLSDKAYTDAAATMLKAIDGISSRTQGRIGAMASAPVASKIALM